MQQSHQGYGFTANFVEENVTSKFGQNPFSHGCCVLKSGERPDLRMFADKGKSLFDGSAEPVGSIGISVGNCRDNAGVIGKKK
jgi:hypothetical protein